MIPIDLLNAQNTRMLKRKDQDWQRLIQSTGQPDFLSEKNRKIYLAKEEKRNSERKQKYMDVKMKTIDPQSTMTDKALVGGAGERNY